jgi:hypothetical protein
MLALTTCARTHLYEYTKDRTNEMDSGNQHVCVYMVMSESCGETRQMKVLVPMHGRIRKFNQNMWSSI